MSTASLHASKGGNNTTSNGQVQPIINNVNDDGSNDGNNSANSSIARTNEYDIVLPLMLDARAGKKKEPLWLVLAESSNDCGDSIDVSHRTTNNNTKQQKGALVASAESRDAYIQEMVQTTQSGYTVTKITTLQDLRDALLLSSQVQVATTALPNENNHPSLRWTTRTESAALMNSVSNFTFTPPGLDEVKRFGMFREVIEHEDDLLNQRVSWIILAQSFLMAAFISAASNIDNRSFLYITAGVGLATVIVTMPALIAAGQNIEIQQRVYFLGLQSDEQCQRLHGHDRDIILKNPKEMIQRSTKGHVLPNTAYRGRFGIPILKTVLALAIVQVAGWCGLLVALVMDW